MLHTFLRICHPGGIMSNSRLTAPLRWCLESHHLPQRSFPSTPQGLESGQGSVEAEGGEPRASPTSVLKLSSLISSPSELAGKVCSVSGCLASEQTLTPRRRWMLRKRPRWQQTPGSQDTNGILPSYCFSKKLSYNARNRRQRKIMPGMLVRNS